MFSLIDLVMFITLVFLVLANPLMQLYPPILVVSNASERANIAYTYASVCARAHVIYLIVLYAVCGMRWLLGYSSLLPAIIWSLVSSITMYFVSRHVERIHRPLPLARADFAPALAVRSPHPGSDAGLQQRLSAIIALRDNTEAAAENASMLVYLVRTGTASVNNFIAGKPLTRARPPLAHAPRLWLQVTAAEHHLITAAPVHARIALADAHVATECARVLAGVAGRLGGGGRGEGAGEGEVSDDVVEAVRELGQAMNAAVLAARKGSVWQDINRAEYAIHPWPVLGPGSWEMLGAAAADATCRIENAMKCK